MSVFQFKQFSIQQNNVAMKVGTDAMLLGAIVSVESKSHALDIGAGTGVLSLMIAQRNLEIDVEGVEVDPQTAHECELNFLNSPWRERLVVKCVDFSKFTSPKVYDVIVSNPPFYESTLLNIDKRKADARHAQSLPMDVLIKKVNDLLANDGDFWIIVPSEFGEKWIRECNKYSLHLTMQTTIFGKSGGDAKRVVFNFTRLKKSTRSNQLTIRNDTGGYSEAYKKLTEEFHFKTL